MAEAVGRRKRQFRIIAEGLDSKSD